MNWTDWGLCQVQSYSLPRIFRGGNMVDLVFTNAKDTHRAAPLPHVGNSDHLGVMLTPTYIPRVKQGRSEVREVRIWPQ